MRIQYHTSTAAALQVSTRPNPRLCDGQVSNLGVIGHLCAGKVDVTNQPTLATQSSMCKPARQPVDLLIWPASASDIANNDRVTIGPSYPGVEGRFDRNSPVGRPPARSGFATTAALTGEHGREPPNVTMGPSRAGETVAGGLAPRSTIEGEPAQVVAQPLVVEHELPDLVGKLGALPSALQGTSVVTLGRCRAGGPDCVRRRAQLVGGNVCDGRGLAGSVRGMPWRPTQVSGRGVRMTGRRASLRHRASHPAPRRAPGRSHVAGDRPPAGPARKGAARAARSRPPTPRAGDDRRPGGCRRDAR